MFIFYAYSDFSMYQNIYQYLFSQNRFAVTGKANFEISENSLERDECSSDGDESSEKCWPSYRYFSNVPYDFTIPRFFSCLGPHHFPCWGRRHREIFRFFNFSPCIHKQGAGVALFFLSWSRMVWLRTTTDTFRILLQICVLTT
jgi:hypothetical protein